MLGPTTNSSGRLPALRTRGTGTARRTTPVALRNELDGLPTTPARTE